MAEEKAQPQADQVSEALDQLQVVFNPLLRFILRYLAIALCVLLLADWLIGMQAFTGDLLRLPTAVLVILELVLIGQLFERIPEVFRLAWNQGVVSNSSQADEETFVAFIHRLRSLLNHRLSWVSGAIFALIALSLTYPAAFYFKTGHSPFSFQGLVAYYTLGNAAFVAPVIGYILGLLVWRVGVAAWFVGRFGREFKLQVVPDHPDQCGGLKPFGDFCLLVAIILLLPALFLSYWGVLAAYFPLTGGDLVTLLWGVAYRRWLLVLILGGFFLFFQPLYQIHRQMDQRRQEMELQLAELSQKVGQISAELRTQADTLTPAQGKEKLDQLDFIDKIYQKYSRVPTWPFDGRTLLKFGAAQVVPVLSLLGTGDKAIALVKSLLGGG